MFTAMAPFLLAALASLPGLFAPDPAFSLWQFGRTQQVRARDPADETRIRTYLTRLGGSARYAAPAARTAFMISALSVGRTAPDITGTDLDGQTFSLSDYRGKVVVLMFSGDWCGICRAQYPYERQLQDLYGSGRAPFALLSIDSGDSPAATRAVLAREGLTYRVWWDGGGPKPTAGPIATRWNALGWPATYVLDEQGVIRYVDLLRDDLVHAVGTLVTAAHARAGQRER